ncbi:MAG: ABC transporter ATP-binding protein [Oscillospiraceae bacterium]|jgi:ABC-type lipoprotein export system ATPase subunit|nr:ABC transporter ATP-binding protein [Oscillospiraceae bacterium]
MDEMIRLTNVRKVYRSSGSGAMVEALRVDRLSILAGERAGIRGRSGSGKTTLLHVISGILTPSGGEVMVNGARLDTLGEPKRDLFRARNVGCIFQFFHLIPYLTAKENVTAAMLFAGGAMSRRMMGERADFLLESVGLGGRLHHMPGQLSGGEQQRVCVARALANDPPILIADEPTANLDPRNKDIILRLLYRANEENRLTLLLATHDRDALSGFTRVIDLDDMSAMEGEAAC